MTKRELIKILEEEVKSLEETAKNEEENGLLNNVGYIRGQILGLEKAIMALETL